MNFQHYVINIILNNETLIRESRAVITYTSSCEPRNHIIFLEYTSTYISYIAAGHIHPQMHNYYSVEPRSKGHPTQNHGTW